MVGWQRNFSSIVRQFVSGAEQQIHARTGLLTPLAKCYSTQEIPHVKHKLGAASEPTYQQFRCYARYLGFSSSRPLHANASDDGSMQPVPSPLTPLPGPRGGSADSKAVVNKPDKVQAVLKNIKQSPKKLNLVAALVRGMTVEDALIQLQVTVKRAAKTVYQVIHSARANATHNHGLDSDRLLVAEAHVGKGRFLKRVNYHGRGKCGVRVKPESRLTVVVRELTPEEEAKIARLKVSKFRKFSKRERQLIPHKLIESTPRWHHKRRARDQVSTTPAA